LALIKFHLEISGNSFNDEQPQNNPEISLVLLTFHLEILGNDFNEEHLQNKKEISLPFDIRYFLAAFIHQNFNFWPFSRNST